MTMSAAASKRAWQGGERALRDLVPRRDRGGFGAQFIHARQQCLDVRGLHVCIKRGFPGPVFVEEKLRGTLGRDVEIVIDAAGFLARGCDEADERGAQLGFLARSGFKRGDNGECFHFGIFSCVWCPESFRGKYFVVNPKKQECTPPQRADRRRR